MSRYLNAEFVRWNKRLSDLAEKVLTEGCTNNDLLKIISLKEELLNTRGSGLTEMEYRTLYSYLVKIRSHIKEHLKEDEAND